MGTGWAERAAVESLVKKGLGFRVLGLILGIDPTPCASCSVRSACDTSVLDLHFTCSASPRSGTQRLFGHADNPKTKRGNRIGSLRCLGLGL